MSIYEEFEKMFGCVPSDVSLRQLPVDTVCGKDCMEAMIAAELLIEQVQKASPDLVASVLTVLEKTISIFWRG